MVAAVLVLQICFTEEAGRELQSFPRGELGSMLPERNYVHIFLRPVETCATAGAFLAAEAHLSWEAA